MKSVLIREGVVVSDRPDPVPAPGEALVRVRLAGICGTDLELARGYMRFRGVPGHEFVGVVEEAAAPDAERAHWLGRRVVGEINVACGACTVCARGLGRHCPTRSVVGILGKDGAHAERLTLPLRNLHMVPDSIADGAAVFVEPLAAACEILDQVRVAASDRVLVVGAGRLGQLAARVVRTVAKSVTVLGRNRSKLDRLTAYDIETSTDPTALPRDFDLAIEATGSPAGLDVALGLLRPRGTLVLKSTYHGDPHWPAARVVIDEITIVGSRCGRFEAALPLLESGAVRVDDLISEVHPLVEAPRAYARAAEPGVLKVLLEP